MVIGGRACGRPPVSLRTASRRIWPGRSQEKACCGARRHWRLHGPMTSIGEASSCQPCHSDGKQSDIVLQQTGPLPPPPPPQLCTHIHTHTNKHMEQDRHRDGFRATRSSTCRSKFPGTSIMCRVVGSWMGVAGRRESLGELVSIRPRFPADSGLGAKLSHYLFITRFDSLQQMHLCRGCFHARPMAAPLGGAELRSTHFDQGNESSFSDAALTGGEWGVEARETLPFTLMGFEDFGALSGHHVNALTHLIFLALRGKSEIVEEE